MKTSLIIAFAILILAKQIVCLTETLLLTDKNNTKNDITESNIHDEKANIITQNVSIHPSDKNSDIELDELASMETKLLIVKYIIISICITIAVFLGFYCGIMSAPYCLPYEDGFEEDDFPLRPVQQVLMPDEIELQPRRRREREVPIEEEAEM